MDYQDYYKILGVDKSASINEIKKQYRRLARKYHPDVSTEINAEENFKKVKEAYEVLKDPEKRKAYDNLGANWQQGEQFKAPPGWQYYQSNVDKNTQSDINDFTDFFSSLFGQNFYERSFRNQRPSYQRGLDQHTKINLTLNEAYHGSQKIIELQEPDFNIKSHNFKTRTVKVKIPAGVVQGQQIRLVGQGESGTGGAPNGDLYLEIHLIDHPIFTIKKYDIYLNLPISPWEAALGSKIKVPTLAGTVELVIPPGSQSGKILRLKGKGLPGNSPGDQYVILMIYAPVAKNARQKELYQALEKEMNYNPRENIH